MSCAAPTITDHPQDLLAGAGMTGLQFSCSASGVTSPTITWERVNADSTTTPITTGISTTMPSATTSQSTLALPPVSYSDFGMRRCVATVSSMTTESNTAILTG